MVKQLRNRDLHGNWVIIFCRVCEKSLDDSQKGAITRNFESEFNTNTMDIYI